jgi:hypothetical protein
MSIGNLKTQGGKGTNFPFQWNVLRGLQGIIDVLASSTTGVERTAGIERVTGIWSNSYITYSFSVANVGIANGIFQGNVIKPGEIVNYDGGALNNFFKIGAISADGTDTELLISYIY